MAGTKKLVSQKVTRPNERVVAVLTGNVLKDPAYTMAYRQGTLVYPGSDGQEKQIQPRFANQPKSVPSDAVRLQRLLAHASE